MVFFVLQQHEAENSTYQKALADNTQMYEKKMAGLNKQLEDERACTKSFEEQLDMTKKLLSDSQKLNQVSVSVSYLSLVGLWLL